ncbi:homocysteine S-methyltransferase family protein [Pseudomonadota bacterium]
MGKYRSNLPQLAGKFFLTDGGMGTTLIFHKGIDLPHFCAFHLLNDKAGLETLHEYFRSYAAIARDCGLGLILDSGPTWRASADWGNKLGYSHEALEKANRKAIDMLSEIREEFENENTWVVISGCMGPRGDGYEPGRMMTSQEAQRYHAEQIETFSSTIADQVTAMTMTYAEEAIGIIRAAQAADLPAIISFTVEIDGRLPTGQTIGDAINTVDDATAGGAAYYMINCAHPTHFINALSNKASWTARIKGVRLNASTLSHAELNEAEDLDDGDPVELGALVSNIHNTFPHINVVGGCCGTDTRHIREFAAHIKDLPA